MAGEDRVVHRGASPLPAAYDEEHNNAIDDLESLRTELVNAMNGDLLLTAPALAIGTSSKKAVKHGDIVFQIDGMRYRIAAAEAAFTATTHDIADPDAEPREAIFVVSAGAGASAVTLTKGADAAADEAEAPATPAGHVKFGEVLIQHDGSAVFDATTDDLDAEHLTVAYTDATPWAMAASALTAGKINP